MYKVIIGIEMHAEVLTNSKMFSRSKNDYNEIPNINVTPLDIGLPGTLPVVNKSGVKKGIEMALCLGCEIPRYLVFDRKNYYYPDLPKGYQITQSHYPIGINGKITIPFNDEERDVLIHDIHLEEDTASLDHYYDYSLINYNRSGVPLIEIVTEPCITSADMAVSFVEYIVNVLRYCNISEADTKKGQIRCDVNVSLMKENDVKLGTKVEIKNINSIGNIYDAILYEIARQTEILNNGDKVLQETRRFDEETGTTILMRSKEDAIDYKYFVEPNIPKIEIDLDWIKQIKNEIPELPINRKRHYIKDLNINSTDANILIKDINVSNYFEECVKLGIEPKTASNWIITEISGVLNKEGISIKDFFIIPTYLKTILDKLIQGDISSKQAKEIFYKSLAEKKDPISLLNGFSQLSDENELKNIIINILNNNESLIIEYKNGRNNVFDYFVGQVMKETKGKANPILTKKILTEELESK